MFNSQLGVIQGICIVSVEVKWFGLVLGGVAWWLKVSGK